MTHHASYCVVLFTVKRIRVAIDETDDNCGGAELMLLGFISLLLSVFQGAGQKI